MNIVFYIIIFIVGTILGSFYANIIKRILKSKKVLSIHSYCGSCGKKLVFFEKIPIFSYILLKGKCKNCDKEIDKKYMILEIAMGIILLLIARGLQLGVSNISVVGIISFILLNLYIAYILIVINLDKQKRSIPSSVLAYGIIVSIIYIAYLCITESASIYRNLIYLVAIIILLLINAINIKRRAEDSYIINLLITILIMLIFTEKMVCLLTLEATLFAIPLYVLINKTKKAKIKNQKTSFSRKINVLYISGILNLITFLVLTNILS